MIAYQRAREFQESPEVDPASRILVADDDPEMGDLVKDVLLRDGYEVDLVRSGRDLIRQLSRHVGHPHMETPDLVISDHRMPEVTGLEVLIGLRQAEWWMPMIIISGFADGAMRAEATRLNAVVLSKPFPMQTLRDLVHEMVPPTA